MLGATGLATDARRDHREAVRHRSRLGEGAQPDGPRRLRRVAGLPHRPLPREGIDRQHPRLPLRQRAVRADLEPRARRATSRSTCPRRSSIEGRAEFYEQTGAFRDMVVTHLLQVLGFVAMEPPTSLAAKALRDEKVKVFEAMPADRRRQRRAWPVHGLPERARRRPELADRDVRGAQGRGRQLAVGRRAVLPAHRQEPGPEPPGHHARAPRAHAADVPERGRSRARAAATATRS